MEPLLAQVRQNTQQWLQFLGLAIVIGFSILTWVLKKLQEQNARKKVQEEIERRELEHLRTGHAPAPSHHAAPATHEVPRSETETDRRLEELRRRREALARRRAEEAGARQPGPREPIPASVVLRPPPAPIQNRPAQPIIFIPGSSGPIIVQRSTPATPPAEARPDRPGRQRSRSKRTAQKAQPQVQPQNRQGTLRERMADAETAPLPLTHVAHSAPSAEGMPLTPADWRRAIVAREIFARPVALRPDNEQTFL
ncbi:MAG: hypothetical protein WD749_12580 [Phycisphaerales bacterium]